MTAVAGKIVRNRAKYQYAGVEPLEVDRVWAPYLVKRFDFGAIYNIRRTRVAELWHNEIQNAARLIPPWPVVSWIDVPPRRQDIV